MFVAVIVGNLLAVLFAFCGVVSVCGYLGGEMSARTVTGMMQGLALSAWPLAVAGAIYLLVQIACMVEKKVAADTAEPEVRTKAEPVFDKAKKTKEEVAESGRFFKANPVPPPPPPSASTEADAAVTPKSDTTSLIPAPVAAEEAPPKKPAHSLNFFRVE